MRWFGIYTFYYFRNSVSLSSFSQKFFCREKNLYKVSVLLILPRLMRVRGKSVAAVANETIFTGCGFWTLRPSAVSIVNRFTFWWFFFVWLKLVRRWREREENQRNKLILIVLLSFLLALFISHLRALRVPFYSRLHWFVQCGCGQDRDKRTCECAKCAC